MANDDNAADAGSNELRDLRARAAKADEYLDLLRRTKADFINFQDRIRREREEWSREGLRDFVRDFLPALDSFTWARFEEPTLMESLHLVEREFLRALARHHIVPIATADRIFDPLYHEAVAVEETTKKPPGSILEQVRRGWMMGNQVLRPAGVRVAKAPPAEGGSTTDAAPSAAKEPEE
ncbi:MAG TPA: nucleotide exchange factor GrpE [Planctomycetota bacterium]|jgi:molecular chaperone GrpE|nr:nucleotide exchange factor GrpE [Planctomycetota bacterium]